MSRTALNCNISFYLELLHQSSHCTYLCIFSMSHMNYKNCSLHFAWRDFNPSWQHPVKNGRIYMRECWKKQKQRKTMKMNEFGAATPLISWPTHLITCKKLKTNGNFYQHEKEIHICCVSGGAVKSYQLKPYNCCNSNPKSNHWNQSFSLN